MADKALPPPDALRQLLRYDPETGKLFWRERDGCKRFNTTWAGREAFTATNGYGYKVGSVNNRGLLAHRVIWAMMTGAWPDDEIDHRDTDRQNNRFGNLRLATTAQNARNRNLRSDNLSGAKGVTRLPSGKWQARIMADGVAKFLGAFNCQTAAAIAYAKSSQTIHGDFGRSGAGLGRHAGRGRAKGW